MALWSPISFCCSASASSRSPRRSSPSICRWRDGISGRRCCSSAAPTWRSPFSTTSSGASRPPATGSLPRVTKRKPTGSRRPSGLGSPATPWPPCSPLWRSRLASPWTRRSLCTTCCPGGRHPRQGSVSCPTHLALQRSAARSNLLEDTVRPPSGIEGVEQVPRLIEAEVAHASLVLDADLVPDEGRPAPAGGVELDPAAQGFHLGEDARRLDREALGEQRRKLCRLVSDHAAPGSGSLLTPARRRSAPAPARCRRRRRPCASPSGRCPVRR